MASPLLDHANALCAKADKRLGGINMIGVLRMLEEVTRNRRTG